MFVNPPPTMSVDPEMVRLFTKLLGIGFHDCIREPVPVVRTVPRLFLIVPLNVVKDPPTKRVDPETARP
jgi:hypothetical protein